MAEPSSPVGAWWQLFCASQDAEAEAQKAQDEAAEADRKADLFFPDQKIRIPK